MMSTLMHMGLQLEIHGSRNIQFLRVNCKCFLCHGPSATGWGRRSPLKRDVTSHDLARRRCHYSTVLHVCRTRPVTRPDTSNPPVHRDTVLTSLRPSFVKFRATLVSAAFDHLLIRFLSQGNVSSRGLGLVIGNQRRPRLLRHIAS